MWLSGDLYPFVLSGKILAQILPDDILPIHDALVMWLSGCTSEKYVKISIMNGGARWEAFRCQEIRGVDPNNEADTGGLAVIGPLFTPKYNEKEMSKMILSWRGYQPIGLGMLFSIAANEDPAADISPPKNIPCPLITTTDKRRVSYTNEQFEPGNSGRVLVLIPLSATNADLIISRASNWKRSGWVVISDKKIINQLSDEVTQERIVNHGKNLWRVRLGDNRRQAEHVIQCVENDGQDCFSAKRWIPAPIPHLLSYEDLNKKLSKENDKVRFDKIGNIFIEGEFVLGVLTKKSKQYIDHIIDLLN